MNLKNASVLVTGGSGGIGSEVANAFLKKGARVMILARDKKNMEEVLEHLKKQGTAEGISADVSNWEEARKAVRTVQEKYGKIDILVNAAGIQAPIGLFEENKIEAWRKNVETNLLGTVHMCKAVLPEMMKRGEGNIVNFSGGGATSKRENFSAYAVAKTGIVRFTEILAGEVKKYNIRVNAISPGAVYTRMLDEIVEAGERAGEERETAKRVIKEGKATPDQAAELALFLASDASCDLSGKLISAIWDDWKSWDKKKIEEINKSDLYTLRRITP